MVFTWLIVALTGIVLVSAFFEEIMDWAKDMFNRLSSSVKKAWVYIRRVPGGIKQMIRYIQNGTMLVDSVTKVMEWEEIVEMHENGEMDDDTFNALKAERDKKIAEIDRAH